MSTARNTKFELTGADGGPLRGEVRTAGDGSGRPPVVICHGFKGCKDWSFFPRLAERIARAGMTSITFNFSGSGVGADGEGFSEQERFAHSTFSNDSKDLDTVCRALTGGDLIEGLVGADRYGLFGYSRGGGTAVLHAAENQAIAALVTWAAISHTDRWDADTMSEWRATGRRVPPGVEDDAGLFFYTDMLDDILENREALDVTAAASRIEAPWLMIHGTDDDFVPESEALDLHRAAAGGNAVLKLMEGGNHTFDASGQLDAAVDRTLAWFSRHLF